MDSWPPQGLDRLYRREVFRSRCPVETHALVSRELKDHRLTWGRGKVDAAFHRAELGTMTLCILRYGAAVHIEPDRLKHFMLVQMPLRGRAQVDCGDASLCIEPRHAALIAPHRPLRIDWQAGCEQLMLKIPRDRLLAVAARAFAEEDEGPGTLISSEDAIDFVPAFSLETEVGRTWCRLMEDLIHFLPAGEAAGPSGTWLRRFEETVILFLLCHQPNSLTAIGTTRAFAGSPRQLALAEDYMRENIGEEISLIDIATAARVSLRSLNHLFHRYRDASPMNVLRNLRLDAARARLLRDDDASVTDVAFACGFSHLGRFADYYRRRFGELPKMTGAWRRRGPGG